MELSNPVLEKYPLGVRWTTQEHLTWPLLDTIVSKVFAFGSYCMVMQGIRMCCVAGECIGLVVAIGPNTVLSTFIENGQWG